MENRDHYDDVTDVQDVETKLNRCEEEYKDKTNYYGDILNQSKINNNF
jgi:hypothetical protein